MNERLRKGRLAGKRDSGTFVKQRKEGKTVCAMCCAVERTVGRSRVDRREQSKREKRTLQPTYEKFIALCNSHLGPECQGQYSSPLLRFPLCFILYTIVLHKELFRGCKVLPFFHSAIYSSVVVRSFPLFTQSIGRRARAGRYIRSFCSSSSSTAILPPFLLSDFVRVTV